MKVSRLVELLGECDPEAQIYTKDWDPITVIAEEVSYTMEEGVQESSVVLLK